MRTHNALRFNAFLRLSTGVVQYNGEKKTFRRLIN